MIGPGEYIEYERTWETLAGDRYGVIKFRNRKRYMLHRSVPGRLYVLAYFKDMARAMEFIEIMERLVNVPLPVATGGNDVSPVREPGFRSMRASFECPWCKEPTFGPEGLLCVRCYKLYKNPAELT